MSTTYTTRTRPSSTYSTRTRVSSTYGSRTRQTKRKTYLIGYDDLGDLVYICDQDGNRIVIYSDTGFEQVDYNTWNTRTRI